MSGVANHAPFAATTAPEYISGKLVLGAEKHGIRLEYIQPGNTQQNACVERYAWLGH